MCQHTWTYRNGRSVCLRCPETANDTRGLPHGHYAINGAAISAGTLLTKFACPTCLANINPRMVDGEFKILCAGTDAHDIAVMGRAITKEARDAILLRQQQDYYTIVDGLPPELRRVIQCLSRD